MKYQTHLGALPQRQDLKAADADNSGVGRNGLLQSSQEPKLVATLGGALR